MDYRIFVLLIIIGIYGIRVLYGFYKNRSFSFLIVSLFVFFLPFTLNLIHFPAYPDSRSGAFNQTFALEPYVFFFIFCSFYVIIIQRKLLINRLGNVVSVTLLLIFILSYFNPANTFPLRTLLLFIRLIVFTGVLVLVSQMFTQKVVFKGIYDGFAGLVLLQFILAIAFPILGIKEVTNIFLEGAMDWAVEARGGRNSAIGIFGHPGNLALFMSVCIVMFYSFFLHNIRKRTSLFLLVLSVFTLFTSFSRSGLISSIISFLIISFVYKKPHRSFFSLKNLVLLMVGGGLLLLFVIVFTPIGEYFHNDDFSQMASARMIHWIAGYEVFIRHPLLGVGLNSHLTFFSEKLPILDGFFARSPIHNIHIIILSEMGIFGFLLWFIFIIKSIRDAQKQLTLSMHREASALNLTLIGALVSYFIYGFFGWAPFANEQLSVLFLIYYFAFNYKSCEI